MSNGPQSPTDEFAYKVLVVGDPGTGKTALVQRYVEGVYSGNYKTTIGVDFALKTLQRGDATVHLHMWYAKSSSSPRHLGNLNYVEIIRDVVGQERFGTLTRFYYRGAVGAFVAFDITSESTFENVLRWKEDIDNKVLLPNGERLPMVLLANKCDLAKQQVSEEIMNAYCCQHGFVGWFATSAKENINVHQAMDFFVDYLHGSRGNDSPRLPSAAVSLARRSHRSPQNSSCC